MNLSFNFIKSVSNIYDEMVSNGFSLVYLGEFSHDVTKMFTNLTETDMERKCEERTVQRKVFHVMVETLQNLSKHSAEMTDEVGSGLFIIGKKEDTYFVITSNKVRVDDRENLESALKQVNDASPEDLKEMYKRQIQAGTLSSRGGAGLGLIDIARKTGEKLEHQFLQLDEDNLFFILKVAVNTKKFQK